MLLEAPAPKPVQSATTTPSASPAAPPNLQQQPLSARITIKTPTSGANVGKEFTVTGSAPGPWYFEASFPIQVRGAEGSVIGRTHANALGEWTTEKNVDFDATVHIEATHTGPATLILMKDNPSGLPENDDSVEIPIVIQ